MIPECTCGWQYVWHYTGPKRVMQERDCVLSDYHTDCPVPAHAALANLNTIREPAAIIEDLFNRLSDALEAIDPKETTSGTH